MNYTAAVITVSDKGCRGEREDTSGPNLCRLLRERGFLVEHKERAHKLRRRSGNRPHTYHRRHRLLPKGCHPRGHHGGGGAAHSRHTRGHARRQ